MRIVRAAAATLLILPVLTIAGWGAPVEHVSFGTRDGGRIYADLYGESQRAVILVPGMRLRKETWTAQAKTLEAAGFKVLAIDPRGIGDSHGGPTPALDNGYSLDIRGAAKYLRENGARMVAVIAAGPGGGGAAKAAIEGGAEEIDRLVLLSHSPVAEPARIPGRKLFITSEGDPKLARIREQHELAVPPKTLLVAVGDEQGQEILTGPDGTRMMRAILRFLSE